MGGGGGGGGWWNVCGDEGGGGESCVRWWNWMRGRPLGECRPRDTGVVGGRLWGTAEGIGRGVADAL